MCIKLFVMCTLQLAYTYTYRPKYAHTVTYTTCKYNCLQCRLHQKSLTYWLEGRWTGNEFQTMRAATGNERRPMVVRRYGGTSSWSADDDRRRRRLGRSNAETSWFKYSGAVPHSTRYDMSASLKLTRSGRRSQWSIARASVTWS